MLTSANLSKQAWGETVRSTGEIRIASWEVGVLVWPELMESGSVMTPTFQSDKPDNETWAAVDGAEERPMVGVRVPYNLPLQRYAEGEVPWVTSMAHAEPDNRGCTWGI